MRDKAHCEQCIVELGFDAPACDGARRILSGLGNIGIVKGALPSGCATHESFAQTMRCC